MTNKTRPKSMETAIRTKPIRTALPPGRTPQKSAASKTKQDLTPQDEKIIKAYIENGGNQSAAYRTGKPISRKWKDKTVHSRASEFFAQSKVQGRLQEIRGKVEQKTEITAGYIARTIMDVVERCLDEDSFQASPALKGAELLAKHIGWFEQDNAQKNPVIAVLESMSPDKRERVLARLDMIATQSQVTH